MQWSYWKKVSPFILKEGAPFHTVKEIRERSKIKIPYKVPPQAKCLLAHVVLGSAHVHTRARRRDAGPEARSRAFYGSPAPFPAAENGAGLAAASVLRSVEVAARVSPALDSWIISAPWWICGTGTPSRFKDEGGKSPPKPDSRGLGPLWLIDSFPGVAVRRDFALV